MGEENLSQSTIRYCFSVGQSVLVRVGNDWYTRKIEKITVLRSEVQCPQCKMPIQGEPRIWFKDYGNVPLQDVMALEDIDPSIIKAHVTLVE